MSGVGWTEPPESGGAGSAGAEAGTRLCVVHLARAANGVEPFAAFFDSYRRFAAGIEHDLLVVCKGFADDRLPAEHARILEGLPHSLRFIPDEGFDLDAYILAAREGEAEFFCFLNSFSVILAEDWLTKLYRQASQPGVGIVGATGSFETLAWDLFKGAEEHTLAVMLAACPHLVPIARDFPPFPNPHIRSNAFVCRREHLLAAANGPLESKHDAHAFESGRRGLTRRIREQGLAALVVGRDGRAYEEAEWPESRTFRSGNQENLLIEDNQSRHNMLAAPEVRAELWLAAWGDRAHVGGPLNPGAATPTTAPSIAMTAPVNDLSGFFTPLGRGTRAAFCDAVGAFALDPSDPARSAMVKASFAAVEQIAPLGAAQEALSLETNGFAILASATEVAAEPGLLVAFAEAFAADDPVTLVLAAPGRDQAELEQALAPAIAAAGGLNGSSPDAVLFVPELDEAGEELLAASAIARLCSSDDVGGVGPASFAAEQLPALRALVELLAAPPEPPSEPPPPAIEVGFGTYCIEPYDFRTYIPGERIVIGKYCSIAAFTTILCGGHHRSDVASTYPFDVQLLHRAGWPDGYAADPSINRSYQSNKPTTIGNDVWIGHGATVTGGVNVGHGAVVATRAVVFQDVPPYAIVAGNPARVVRYRFSKDIVERLLRIAWWDWPEETVRERVDWFYRPINEFVEAFDPDPPVPDDQRARTP
jgi:acetyltransferase-like isoleucine patch superfamily enzyme